MEISAITPDKSLGPPISIKLVSQEDKGEFYHHFEFLFQARNGLMPHNEVKLLTAASPGLKFIPHWS